MEGKAQEESGALAVLLRAETLKESLILSLPWLRSFRQYFLPNKRTNWLNKEFWIMHNDRKIFFNKIFLRPSSLNQHLYDEIFYTSLPSLLRYEDRNSMAHSIETRLPFLDFRLVEFLFSLPAKEKIGSGLTKVILRKSMNGIIPEKVRMRKDKMGFVTPESKWIENELKQKIYEIINSNRFKECGYFDVTEVKHEWERMKSNNLINSTPWKWLNLIVWMELFKVTN